MERITKSVIGDAKKEASRIIHAAQIATQRKIDSAKEELRKNLTERLKTVEVELEEKKAIELSNLGAGYKQRLLEVKNGAIDDVFKRAMQQVTLLPDKKYLSLIEKWLRAIDTTGQISISRKDSKRINQEFVSKINQSRKKSSKLSLSKDFADISVGFILKTKKFEIDYSLDTLASNLREQLGPKIAQELFGKQTM